MSKRKKRMKPDAYMPFYGSNFFEATRGFNDQESMAYLRALWHYWHHTHCDGLRDDDSYLFEVCDCEKANWARIKGLIFDNDERYFFILARGKWHQKNAADIYAYSIEAYNKKVAAVAKARASAVNSTDNSPVNRQQEEQELEPTTLVSVVELPPGFPKTAEEAKNACPTIAAPPEFLETLWLTARGRSGRDSKDVAITSWPHYAAAAWNYEQNRRAEANSKPRGKHAPKSTAPNYEQKDW